MDGCGRRLITRLKLLFLCRLVAFTDRDRKVVDIGQWVDILSL